MSGGPGVVDVEKRPGPAVDRSSRPTGSPRRTLSTGQDQMERLRRDRKLGPARIAAELCRDGASISPAGGAPGAGAAPGEGLGPTQAPGPLLASK
jgi:hypothetical protein